MANSLEYRGYIGSVQYSHEDKVFFGKIEKIDDLVTFAFDIVTELETVFQKCVDGYLLTCKELEMSQNNTRKRSGNFIGMLDGQIGDQNV